MGCAARARCDAGTLHVGALGFWILLGFYAIYNLLHDFLF